MVVPRQKLIGNEEKVLEAFFSEEDWRASELLDKFGFESDEQYFDFRQSPHKVFATEVAKILLGRVQHKLPNFTVFDGQNIVSTRDLGHKRNARSIEYFPHFVFSINWADSSPFISWHQAYWTVFLPELHLNVLIGCLDSDDLYGYQDFVMGYRSVGESLEDFIREEIEYEWAWQHAEWGQRPWENIIDTGLMDKKIIFDMRDRAFAECE